MREKILYYLRLSLYAGAERSTYRKFHRDIANANVRFLRNLCVMGIFMFPLLGVWSVMRHDHVSLIWNIVYTALAFVMFLLYPFLPSVTSHLSNVAAYTSMSAIFLYCIEMGVFLRPENNATPFFVVLVAVPIIMADVPWHIMFMSGMFTVLMLICSYITRGNTDVFAYDVLYSLIFYPVSCFLIPFAVQSNIRHITDKYQLQKDQDLDGLTQLYHRGAARRMINEELTRRRRGFAAMFMIDVDNFKHINDTYGHMAGDMALCDVAKAINSISRNNLIAARYGGDEFILFLYEMESLKAVEKVANNLIEKIFALNRKEAYQFPDYRITVSIGIATGYPKATYESLLSRADEMVYEAKDAGKNCYKIYNR